LRLCQHRTRTKTRTSNIEHRTSNPTSNFQHRTKSCGKRITAEYTEYAENHEVHGRERESLLSFLSKHWDHEPQKLEDENEVERVDEEEEEKEEEKEEEEDLYGSLESFLVVTNLFTGHEPRLVTSSPTMGK
jgi:hypothetical protein